MRVDGRGGVEWRVGDGLAGRVMVWGAGAGGGFCINDKLGFDGCISDWAGLEAKVGGSGGGPCKHTVACFNS